MHLTELFRSLSTGELSNLSLANNGDGTIAASKHEKLINYANEGLLNLYSRYPLREKEVIIQIQETTQHYHLLERYAMSRFPGAGVANPYIQDTPGDPFKEDVIRINSVHSVFGVKLPLNDANAALGVFTPQPHILQVPDAVRADPAIGETLLSIQYQAAHDKLIGVNDPNSIIYLPLCLRGALASYVAYKVYSHMGSDGSNVKAAEYMSMFDNACDIAESNDLVLNTSSDTNKRFALNGWI